MKRTALLFSGGWDSAAAMFASRYHTKSLLFVDYNQTYKNQELRAAIAFAAYFHRHIRVTKLELKHDQSRRNFYFIMEAKRMGFERVIIGSRNLHPWFDKYKDSNWWSLKKFGRMVGVDIDLPVTGWSKKRIVELVQSEYPDPMYNCYLAANDVMICDCPNCREMRTIL